MTTPSYTTACPDWEERLTNGKSIIPEPLYPETAEHFLNIFNNLTLPDIVGTPLIRDISLNWVKRFAACIFGSLNPNTYERDIQQFFLQIPKKNGKSTIAAAVKLSMLIGNEREYADFFVVAPTKEVADNSFVPMMGMVKKNPLLDSILEITPSIRRIRHRYTNATLKVIAADDDSVGFKGTGVLIDEVWRFGKRRNANALFSELRGGLASRKDGFVIYLTTQSDAPPQGVFRDLLYKARQIRDGKVEDKKFLPILYEFPHKMLDDESFRQPENWGIVNPNLNVSVDLEYLKNEYQTAQNIGEDALKIFYSKHLNVEIGLALKSNRWIAADYWERQEKALNLDDLIRNSEVITVGIDGGGLDDLLGLAVIGRTPQGEWLQWAKAWVTAEIIANRPSIAVVIKDLADTGDLVLVEKMGDDIAELLQIIHKIYDSNLLDTIGIDPHGIGGILDGLNSVGIEEDKIVGISQGWKLMTAIKTCERKLAERKLYVAQSHLMRWCVSNALVEPRANGVMITKSISTAKIDPLMATFNAVELMSRNPAGRGTIEEYFNEMIVV